MVDAFANQAQMTDAELIDVERFPASLIEHFLTSLQGTSWP
jgi:hypothetical protein